MEPHNAMWQSIPSPELGSPIADMSAHTSPSPICLPYSSDLGMPLDPFEPNAASATASLSEWDPIKFRYLATHECIETHSRGDRSGAMDTQKYRAKTPEATGQSYLFQLMVAPHHYPRALLMIQNATLSTSNIGNQVIHQCTGPDTDELQQQCVALAQACASAWSSSDVAGYLVMLRQMELSMWVLR
jgi:hypothetical protein